MNDVLGVGRHDEANAALLAWYSRDGRRMAFRTASDPWAVLVSEVMLQQTQAARVDAAWPAFIERFPSPRRMAVASVGDVLRAWAGLGYNRRAVSLHRAARFIVEEHGGRVPDDVAALERLPGVGAYTARAVAAIAFGQPVAAIDTNLRRVVARTRFGVDPGTTGRAVVGPIELQAAADGSIDRARPAEWTHAMMDVGALLCRSRSPECPRCPLVGCCAYAASGEGGAKRGGARHLRPVPAPTFESTNRWLRGRIVERLRDVPSGHWVAVDEPLGEHSIERVMAAVAALVREGLVERRVDGLVRLPMVAP